jgi:superfamily II DNA or RNA helicase
MTRTERQEQCRVSWIKNKCCGTIIAPTGVGKTRIALNCIRSVLNKYPSFRVIIVVPTTTLQEQWTTQIDEWGLSLNVEILVINSAIKRESYCDLLVIDEAHRAAADTFQQIFQKVHYRLILCLTATLNRIDGKEKIIKAYCPVVDEITLMEATSNNWISTYKEYLVLLKVDDIDKYNNSNRLFNEAFAFFDYNFDLCMKMLGPEGWKHRNAYRDLICPKGTPEERTKSLASINYYSANFNRAMRDRKSFIDKHPKKIEIARKIIQHYNDKKIITFSNNVKMADSIGIGKVYKGSLGKKVAANMISEFNASKTGVLNTIQKANEGLDVKGLSVAIILGLDSSEIKSSQRRGRVIRFEEGKTASIFNLILDDTVEVTWFKNSHKSANYITIDEEGLEQILLGNEPKPYRKKLKEMVFRF